MIAGVSANLEDQKSLVVQVDTAAFEQRGDFAEGATAVIDGIFAGIVPVSGPSNDQLRARYDLVCVRSRLSRERVCVYQREPRDRAKDRPTLSMISSNQTSTEQLSRSSLPSELWINSLNFPCRILLAL